MTTLIEQLAHDRIARGRLVAIYAVGIAVGSAIGIALLTAIA
jgi:hypothetical protein